MVSSSTQYGTSENRSVIADSQTVHPSSLLLPVFTGNRILIFHLKSCISHTYFALLVRPQVLSISSLLFLLHSHLMSHHTQSNNSDNINIGERILKLFNT